MTEAFWLSSEDARVPKLYKLAYQGLPQEGLGEGPACFLGAAGLLPTASLVDAAANFPPPDAEVPQHPASLPQSPYDNTEVMHTDVSMERKRK